MKTGSLAQGKDQEHHIFIKRKNHEKGNNDENEKEVQHKNDNDSHIPLDEWEADDNLRLHDEMDSDSKLNALGQRIFRLFKSNEQHYYIY